MAKKRAPINLPLPAEDIINDYRIAYRSRQTSLIGRREVLSGKAKFGIFGDGKEVAQLAIAHAFQKGDFRAGYYRDQTWMFALGEIGVQEFFAQLYAHADIEADPMTAGRQMNGHFATRLLNADGSWRPQTEMYNVSADLSPTGSQMPKLVGLAYASRLYREIDLLKPLTQFSHNGNEVAWGTIGNASTAEGMFWESVNAIGVLKAPAVITIYDDGYGISVPNQFQMVKENIGEILRGFERDLNAPPDKIEHGYDHYTVAAWDYPALIETYQSASEIAREYHIPALVHVIDVTQPQGHSTSGSHERYKSAERLKWEEEFDCVTRFRNWIIYQGIASEAEIQQWETEDRASVENDRKKSWDAYLAPIMEERRNVSSILSGMENESETVKDIRARLDSVPAPFRRDIHASIHEALVATRGSSSSARGTLIQWKSVQDAIQGDRYSSHVHSVSKENALNVKEIKPAYSEKSPVVMGFEVMNACFDALLARDPRVVAFGEDVGRLGDVNQGFKGMQEKYGEYRVTDTGIREATIVGQAIGMSMRGLRPIAEIQYLDYLLYGLQILSDDVATLQWRTKGGQKAPLIIRTRGHRLEGVWHSGSLMSGIMNLVRGMYLLVPRDMTHAAGFYNTLMQSDEPAIVVEVLNGYRVKEKLPDNIGAMTIPLGVPETLRAGSDVTIVTYGATCRIVLDAAEKLSKTGINVEVIDVQTLLPFDLHGKIAESLKKTNRILFVDEDVPGGTTAYMMNEVIEKQGGYFHLDSAPKTLTGKPHRPAYGSDGDYWSKPNAESIFDAVYGMMNEVDPNRYPKIL